MATNIVLSEAARQYEAHLRAKGLADRTIKGSTQILRISGNTWGDILTTSVKPVHIDRLFQEHDWSPRTRNLYLGQLRQFFAWCRHQGYIGKDFDPTHGWRNQRIPTSDRMRLPVDQFYPLMDAAEHPRDRIALALGLFTFVRGSELTTIRVNDVDMKALTIDIHRVKTKDYDTLPICEELRVELVRYLNWYRETQGQLIGNWYLVPSKKPDTWTSRDGEWVRVEGLADLRPEQKIGHPYTIPQRALATLGYNVGREGFHTLRRSGARALFDALRAEQGTDALLRVASMLGHRDTKVTMHYIGLSQEREARNKSLSGVAMFPDLRHETGLRVVSNDG